MTWKKLRKRTVKNSPDQITFIQEFKAVELGNCHDVWCTASTDEVLEEWKVAVWHQSLTRAPCFWWNHRHNSQQRREWIVNMLYVSTWLLFQKVCRDRVVSGQRSEDQRVKWSVHHLPKKCGSSAPHWMPFSPLSLEGKIPSRTFNCLKSRRESSKLYTVSFRSGKAVVMNTLGSVLASVFFKI